MSKHKLYVENACSPLSLGMAEKVTPKKNINQSNMSEYLKTSEPGSKRKCLTITPIARKIMRKEMNSVESGNENKSTFSTDFDTSQPSTSVCIKSESEVLPIQKVEKPSSESAASKVPDDFDDDIPECIYFSNQKIPYSYQEDEVILTFVLKGQNIFKVSSLSLWRYLEAKKSNPKRTYQSLKNRFLRNIKPHLFTTYQHLIKDQNTVKKVLAKFPELRTQKETRRFLLQRKMPELALKNEATPALNSNTHEYGINLESEKVKTPVFDGNSEDFKPCILASPRNHFPEASFERTVKLCKNLLKVHVNLDKSNQLEAPFSSVVGLSERFKKLKKNSERIPCPTCGRFYRRPVSNDLSASDAESDVLIPDSVETEKNSETKNISLISNKSPRDVDRKMSLSSNSSINSSDSQNLVICLENSDKSEQTLKESNNVIEEVTEKDEIVEIAEVVKTPVTETKSEVEDKTTDKDSDIDLIYEHTLARLHKLIDADEEKTLQRKCLNKNRDLIGFAANAEKNLDSFFLETQLEVETPALTNDCPTQLQVSRPNTQSQRVTRSSTLASNMMKMLGRKPEKGKKLKK